MARVYAEGVTEPVEERQPRLARDLLVAVDSSEPSREGLRLAADIASRTGAHVTVVYVRQRPVAAGLGAGLAAEEIERGLDEIQQTVYERAREVLNDGSISWRFMVRTAPAAGAEILAVTRELGSDIIVLGSRTHSKLHNLVVGSTSEYLVAHSPVPVLVAR